MHFEQVQKIYLSEKNFGLWVFIIMHYFNGLQQKEITI